MKMEVPVIQVPGYSIKKDFRIANDELKNTLIKNLQVSFDQLIETDQLLSEMLNNLQKASANAVIFGGWVRDRVMKYLFHTNFQPRDLDLVVDGLSFTQLQNLLPSNSKSNIFGGFSLTTSTTNLDIWLLENTFLIKELNLPRCFATLPETTVFRINSIIFQPNQLGTKSDIHELGCLDAIARKILDFQSCLIPFPEIQVARALIYSTKLKLKMEPELIKFIKNTCVNQDTVERIRQGLSLHSPEQFLSESIYLFESILASGK